MKCTTVHGLASVFSLAAVTALAFVGGCSANTTEAVGQADSALTAAQCSFFAVNGKVQICHKTDSTTFPYTILDISATACIAGHVQHPGDYVAVNDPTCQGGGCLPAGAPCDATLPCCEGLTCTDGVCAQLDLCAGVSCPAPLCFTSTCDPATGQCSTPIPAPDGTPCTQPGGDEGTCFQGMCTVG